MDNGFWLSIGAWFGWNVAAPVLFILLFAVLGVLGHVPKMLRQHRCKHERFYETSACDAICSDCGKNLGFIGTVRKVRLAKETNNG